MARTALVCVLVVLFALCNGAEASRRLMQSKEPGGDTQVAQCSCPKIMRPVCLADGTFVANNWCIAVRCKQALPGTVAHKHCNTRSAEQQIEEQEEQEEEIEVEEEEPVKQTCKCPKILRPVCLEDGEEVAANECIATKCLNIEPEKLTECWKLKAGFRQSDISGDEAEEEEEEVNEEEDEEGWACAAQFDPVCFKNGTMAGSNPCFASHNPAAEGKEYKSEWCVPEERGAGKGPPVDKGPPTEDEDNFIVCTAEFNPQCTEDGAPVGTNPCKAAQNKKYEGIPYSNEWCKQAVAAGKPMALDIVIGGDSMDLSRSLDEGEEDAAEEDDVEEDDEEDDDEDDEEDDEEEEDVEEEEEDDEEDEEEEDDEEDIIMCTNEFNPQCTEDGTLVGSNPCKAAQNKEFKGVPHSREWCFFPATSKKSVVLDIIAGSVDDEEDEDEKEDPIIVCTADFNPQCTEDGTQVGSNPCKAAQNKEFEGVPVKNEWCLKSQNAVHAGPFVEAFSAEAKPLFDNPLLAAFTSLPTIVTPGGAEVPCCLLYLDPVCTKDKEVVHISRGCALCDPQVPKPSFMFQYHEDWCPEEIRTREPKPQPDEEEDEEDEEEKPKHCLCPLIWNPYCDDSGEIKAGNKCEAECKGLDMAVVSMDKCNHDANDAATQEGTTDTTSMIPNDAAARLEEVVLREESPKAEIFVDEAVVEADEAEDEVEEPEMRSVKEPVCICPLIWDPVCTKDHKQVGANKCDAKCKGHAEGTYSREWCEVPETPRGNDNDAHTPRGNDNDAHTPRGNDYHTPHGDENELHTPREDENDDYTPRVDDGVVDLEAEKVTESWTDEPCKCTRRRSPVCGPDGSEVAPNRCVAECSGMKPAVDFAKSWCPRDTKGSSSNGDGIIGLSRCNCPDIWEPVCYEDDLSYVSANGCYAECYAHADPRRPIVPCPEME